MQQSQQPYVKGGMQLAAPGNGQVPVTPARAKPPASALAVDDTKTEAIVTILATYNQRREYILRTLRNDGLASVLLQHLRQETEREFLRVMKG